MVARRRRARRANPHREAVAANFTNEGGAGGTIRLLRNVMGLWLLEGAAREWAAPRRDLDALIAAAAGLPRAAGLIDVEDYTLLNPPSMTVAIRAQLSARGHAPPSDPTGSRA